MQRARATLAIALIFIAGCVSPAVPAPGTPPVEPEYRIAPPDVLSISVRPAPEITRDLTVRPDGKVSLDLVGDVEVGGKTIRQVRDILEKRLKEFVQRPDVTVILKESASRSIYILGEVRRPGAYPLIGDVTALHAISQAGGLTLFALKSGVRLVRPGDQGVAYAVDFDEISQYGDAKTNHRLQPGDVIYVPPNGFARVGYAIGVVLFPIQQVIGLGSGFYGFGGGGSNNN